MQTQPPARHLRIHGDNIVECERTVNLIRDAMGKTAKIGRPMASFTCPQYTVSSPVFTVTLELFPGFRRWNKDILSIVALQGGMLREAADIVITEVVDGAKENPLLAFEFCAALPAGNQAWQRNGRGFSFASAGIPYFFLADLGGYELSGGRERIAERTPNPAVPFSYISFALQSQRTISPVYSVNIGASEVTQKRFAAFDGFHDFHRFLLAILQNKPHLAEGALDNLHQKTLAVVNDLAVSKRGGKILAEEWKAIYRDITAGHTVSDYLIKRDRIPWSKTAYIKDLTPSIRRLFEIASKHATGLTAANLPACLVAPNERTKLAAAISSVHNGLSQPFLTWLQNPSKPLAICWVMGFKPQGDDARPDRGLPPFIRMLVGPKTEILTVVYGPLSGGHWNMLINDPVRLQENGLWQSIMACSDGLLVDAKDRTNEYRDTVLAYPSSHWLAELTPTVAESILVHPTPTSFGENDIDTALHLILAKLGENVFFEGSCNPPGGDWSGISVISPQTGTILRYLTLPRVSKTEAKRPDHVFQYHACRQTFVAIESKDTLSKVENAIGPRLIRYLSDLFKVPASVEYSPAKHSWSHSCARLDDQFDYVTVAAGLFQSKQRALEDLIRTETDLAVGMEFQQPPYKVTLHMASRTKGGTKLIEAITESTAHEALIKINILQKA